MDQFDLTSLFFVGLIILFVPVIIATLFPIVERALGNILDAFFLRTKRGVFLWAIVVAAIFFIAQRYPVLDMIEFPWWE